jgi:glycerophosphoryl diester phosphodiesterase
MLAIAHRSGNTVAGLREALDAGVDLVECDVHLHRGALEVRHLKTLGRHHLWDKWELVRRADVEGVELRALLAELRGDPRLMLDLKGLRPGLPPAILAALRTAAPDVPLTVCTKHWWMLGAFPPPVNRVLSASNPTTLARLRRRLARAPAFGVSVRLDLLSPPVVAELRGRTDVVMSWPVDSREALATARAVGVDGVISKSLDLLTGLLHEARDPGGA